MTKDQLRALALQATIPVTRVAAGARAMTEGQMFRLANAPEPQVKITVAERDPTEIISVVTDHAGREFYRNGHSEWL